MKDLKIILAFLGICVLLGQNIFAQEQADSKPSVDTDTNLQNDSSKIIPSYWDPITAGNAVMDKLIRVTSAKAKGAHDAEFVCVGNYAYIVEHDNDLEPGHNAGDSEYCVLTIVNLYSLKVERTIPLAKSEQVFANEKLPAGMCFVPRIIQINDQKLRCYFASQSKNMEAQTWYRDFDLKTSTFDDSIYKAKLKTAAGVYDMQPRYFHADAVAHGFKKPAVKMGLYLFDSFKEFNGKRYIAINNFPGKQNALAVLHDDFATFEIVGHYNEPQSQELSESSINRMPDGTWVAICRNDIGNYHFTSSKDGHVWSEGKEMPHVKNGLNSKPTFDKFGDTYYLGWQENTSIEGGRRSVFNVDISRDGKTWNRKYRFQTSASFQYPTFHQLGKTIWLAVTQSDHKGSSDRIMFGKLEDAGQFKTEAVTTTNLNTSKSTPSESMAAPTAPTVPIVTDTPVIITAPGPEFQDEARPGAMIIGMDRTPKGRMWGCWTGTGDKKDGYFIVASSDDGGESWSKPRLIVGARDPLRKTHHGALVGNLWMDPVGRLWLFFDQTTLDGDGPATNWYIRCDTPDAENPTWSEPTCFAFGCTLNKPTILTNGDWLLPVSNWAEKKAWVYASTDQGNSWVPRSHVQFPDWQFDEHMMVELKDGRIWMLARTTGNPYESYSSDKGYTWTKPTPSSILNINSRFFLRRLSSGNLLLVKNGSPKERLTKRSHMSAFLSNDEGATWGTGLLLDERAAVSYPDGFQSPDGMIHILYDWNRHTDAEILMAKFREEDVAAATIQSQDGKLRILVNKATGPKQDQ